MSRRDKHRAANDAKAAELVQSLDALREQIGEAKLDMAARKRAMSPATSSDMAAAMATFAVALVAGLRDGGSPEDILIRIAAEARALAPTLGETVPGDAMRTMAAVLDASRQDGGGV